MSSDAVWEFTRSPLDWQPLLRGLTACRSLRTLKLDDCDIGNAALQVTALTQLTELSVSGADVPTQVHLSASLGARCRLLFPPLSPSVISPR
jgi:hypothetical protein